MMKQALILFLTACQLSAASLHIPFIRNLQSALDQSLLGDDDSFGDFMSVIADYQEVGGDAIMGCMMEDMDLTGIMMASDPVAAALDKFGAENFCDEAGAEKFAAAFDDFQSCSGYSLNTLVESFFGAMVGNSLHCASYIYSTFTNIANSMLLGGQEDIEYPLPRMPDHCAESLYGDNPFGNAVRLYNKFPEKDTKCFANLANDLPDCTLNQWPIPIAGVYLKAISCVYGNAVPVLEESCTRELGALNECLPEGDYSASYQCDNVMKDCAKAEEESMTLDNLIRNAPPMVGRPMSDLCTRMTNSDDTFKAVLDKYEAFRDYCISDKDKAIWDIQPSSKNTLESTVSLASQVEDNAVAAPAVTATPAASKNSSSSKSSSAGGAGVFFAGLLIGAVASMVAMMVMQKKRQSSSSGDMGRYNYVEQELA